MDVEVLALNKPYPFSLPVVDGAISDFLRSDGNILRVFVSAISKNEAMAFRKGSLYCGLLARDGAIVLIWQFRDLNNRLVFTFDCPFDVRLIAEPQLHDVANPNVRLAVNIVAVDSSSRLVRGLRLVSMPYGLTVAFLSAVQDQLVALQSGDEQMSLWMRQSPEQLASQTKMWPMGE